MPENIREKRIFQNIVKCARCGQYHGPMEFEKLDIPCGEMEYWAPCPINGQPILGMVIATVIRAMEKEAIINEQA